MLPVLFLILHRKNNTNLEYMQSSRNNGIRTKHLAAKVLTLAANTSCEFNFLVGKFGWAKVNVNTWLAVCTTLQILGTSLASVEVSVTCLENELRENRKHKTDTQQCL